MADKIQNQIDSIEQQIVVTENEIKKVEEKISAVEIMIDRAQIDLTALEAKPADQTSTSEVDYRRATLSQLRTKEEQLRNEKAQLRTKEEQLRNEKAQLRTKEEQLRTKEERLRSEKEGLSSTSVGEPKPSSDDGIVPSSNDKSIIVPASSPSSQQSVFTLSFAIVEEDTPVFWDLPGADHRAAASFAAFCKAAGCVVKKSASSLDNAVRLRELLAERNSYGIVQSKLPSWSSAIDYTASRKAAKFFEMSFAMWPRLESCEPELAIRCNQRCVPGFNAELKTMGNKGVFDGAATYVALDMTRSFFTKWNPGDSRPYGENYALFYNRPPLGYAVCGAPPLGWILSIEWIGRLFMSAYSQPFYLESEEHQSIISRLDKPDFGEPLDLTSELSKTIWAAGSKKSKDSTVSCCTWTMRPASDGWFYKIKTWDAVEPRFQKGAALAYAAYNKALDAVKTPTSLPTALVRATLLFGCARLAVRMPFLHGRHPTHDQLSSADAKSPLVAGVAEALLWLAERDLLYTDLRPPNVLLLDGSGEPRLLDYDDMRVVAGLGERLRMEGLCALEAAFTDGPGLETNFTRYAGICKALEAALSGDSEGRSPKRQRTDEASGGGAGPAAAALTARAEAPPLPSQ